MKMKRALVVLAVIAGVCTLVLALAFDRQPRLAIELASTPAQVAHVTRLLRENDPRRVKAETARHLTLGSTDLAVLTGHAARGLGGAARVQLGNRRLDVQASVPLRVASFDLWLNLDAVLGERAAGLPGIERLRVGRLPIPVPLGQWLARQALAWLEGNGDGAPLHRMVEQVVLQPTFALVRYRWRADATARVFERLVTPAQQERLRAYTTQLALSAAAAPQPVALTALLPPLFALAAERSADDASAAAENRALLQTLALYVNGKSLMNVLQAARQWPHPRWRSVTLAGREDFPQHFIVSAMLAAQAGGPLADALGLGKEVDDARFGSGFSFNDIAANRAGARFGEFAVNQPRRLQREVAGGVHTAALMPPVADLAEYMSEATFKSRYGGVGSPAYNRVLADIDARVAALALYR